MINIIKKYKYDLMMVFYLQVIQFLSFFYTNKYEKFVEINLVILSFLFIIKDKNKIIYYYRILIYEIIFLLIEYFYQYKYLFFKELIIIILTLILVELKYKYIKKIIFIGKLKILDEIEFLIVMYMIKEVLRFILSILIVLFAIVCMFLTRGEIITWWKS